MRQYQVVGRKAPSETDPNPAVYRMKLFAPNEVIAKSRFWYFLHQMRKMKKTTGEILDVNEVSSWLVACLSWPCDAWSIVTLSIAANTCSCMLSVVGIHTVADHVMYPKHVLTRSCLCACPSCCVGALAVGYWGFGVGLR